MENKSQIDLIFKKSYWTNLIFYHSLTKLITTLPNEKYKISFDFAKNLEFTFMTIQKKSKEKCINTSLIHAFIKYTLDAKILPYQY